MAVPVIESYEKNNGGSTASQTLTCNKPAGVQIGDLLVLIPMNEDASDTPQFSDNKTGWNFVGNGGNSNADAHVGFFWRIADGTEGASESITAQSSDQWVMFYVRISGSHPTAPVDVNNFTQSSSSSNSHQVPAIVTTVDDCLVLYGLSFDGGDGLPFGVSGEGWSQNDEEQTGTSGYNANSGCWGHRGLADHGDSGIATVGCNASDGAAYFQVAIAPPEAAGELYYQSLPATEVSSPGVGKTAQLKRTFAAAMVGITGLALLKDFYRTLATMSAESAAVTLAKSLYRTVAVTAAATPLLFKKVTHQITAVAGSVAYIAKAKVFLKDLTATCIGAAALGKGILKSLAATATGAADLSRWAALKRIVAATSAGNAAMGRLAAFKRSLGGVAIGAAVVSRVNKFKRTLAATAPGVAAVTLAAAFKRTLAAVLAGVAALDAQKLAGGLYYKTLAATTAGVAGMLRGLSLGRTLAANAISAAGVARFGQYRRTLAAAVAAVPTLARRLSLKKILSAVANAVSTLSASKPAEPVVVELQSALTTSLSLQSTLTPSPEVDLLSGLRKTVRLKSRLTEED